MKYLVHPNRPIQPGDTVQLKNGSWGTFVRTPNWWDWIVKGRGHLVCVRTEHRGEEWVFPHQIAHYGMMEDV
jgi:hypothetical protein